MKARIPGAGNAGNMMKRIQQMQEDMERMKDEVEATDFTASAGGNSIEVVVSGAHEVKSVKINPEIIDPEEPEMLEDLVIVAINEAIRKADAAMEQAMSKAQSGLSGLNIPGLGL